MARRRVLLVTLLLIVILVLLAAGVLWYGLPRKTTVTVSVSGPSGMTIKGTCDVDGQPQEMTFTGPKDIVLEGYRVIYSFVSTDDSGEFQVRPRVGGITLMSGGSGDPPRKGIRGWVKSSWWGARPENWFEVFDRDKQPDWLNKPPP
jgi:hypothetical protein